MGFLSKILGEVPAVPVYRADSQTSLRVYNDRIEKVSIGKKDKQPLAGVTATVEQGSQLEKRFTATRIALMGPFALAAPKKRGGEQWLLIEGPDFVWTFKVEPKQSGLAHTLAAHVNRLAAAADTEVP